jgi:hypothetical protein
MGLFHAAKFNFDISSLFVPSFGTKSTLENVDNNNNNNNDESITFFTRKR